jgi:hypothetical protein
MSLRVMHTPAEGLSSILTGLTQGHMQLAAYRRWKFIRGYQKTPDSDLSARSTAP